MDEIRTIPLTAIFTPEFADNLRLVGRMLSLLQSDYPSIWQELLIRALDEPREVKLRG